MVHRVVAVIGRWKRAGSWLPDRGAL